MAECRYLLEYFAFRTVVCFIQALSPRQCARAAEALAAFLHTSLPRRWTRYRVARENLRVAFGDALNDAQADEVIRRMWAHLFRLVTEMVHLPRKLRLDNVTAGTAFKRKSDVIRALCSGRRVLLVSGHIGNWELAVSIFGLFGFRMGLIARKLDNPYLDRWFARFRGCTGHRVIPKKEGFDLLTELLSRGGAVAVLADQDAGSGGVFVEFFGRAASTHKSIALLAIEYDAILCVGYAQRLGETLPNGWPRFELGCADVIDSRDFTTANAVRDLTQRYTAALEQVIRQAPEQYFWLHRRWKTVPRSRARRRAA